MMPPIPRLMDVWRDEDSQQPNGPRHNLVPNKLFKSWTFSPQAGPRHQTRVESVDRPLLAWSFTSRLCKSYAHKTLQSLLVA